jgi:hypothetical protein
MSKRYVIDIDKTICTPGETKESRYTGATPIKERIELINKLYDEGNHITYLTARGMGTYSNDAKLAEARWKQLTELQLRIWECKYHDLFMGKPSGDYYIDDKAVNSDDFFAN